MSDTVVSSQKDRKRNREGSKSEERKEEKKLKIQERRKRKKIEEKPAKKAELRVAAFMYSKNQAIEKEVYHGFRSKVSLVLYEKNSPTNHICPYERYPNKRYHCKRVNDLNLTYRFVLIFS